MTRCLCARSAFAALLTLLALAAAPARAQGGDAAIDASVVPADAPDWQPMEDAFEAADDDDRIVLVHTYAKWCGWCARLDRDVYVNDDVQVVLAEHFAVTRLDMEAPERVAFWGRTMPQHELASLLGVASTPTTLFFDGDGRYLIRYSGFLQPDRFQLLLHYVRQEEYQRMSFQDYVQMIEQAAPQERGG